MSHCLKSKHGGQSKKKKVAVKENTEGKTDKSKTQETSGYEQKKKKDHEPESKRETDFYIFSLKDRVKKKIRG